MARSHFVKKARKDNPVAKKGESYYWWKFRFGGKHYSKTAPKRGQLTQSGFLSQLYDIQDNIDIRGDSAEGDIQDIIGELENLRDECQDSLDNMPEHLQESSDSGMMLTERIDNIENAISELEYIDTEFDEDEGVSAEDWLDNIVDAVEEALSFE